MQGVPKGPDIVTCLWPWKDIGQSLGRMYQISVSVLHKHQGLWFMNVHERLGVQDFTTLAKD